jgi:hypothetical protein
MRRTSIVLALAALAVTLPVTVQAAGEDPVVAAYTETMAGLGESAAATPAGGADIAVGRGTSCANPLVCASPRDFQLAAASILSGGHAGGVYSQTLTICTAPTVCAFGTFRARVTCVTATGNVATIGGVVQQSSQPAVPEGVEVSVTVYDNGRDGDPAPDMLSFIHVDEPVGELEGQCLVGPYPPMFTVVDGDIMVRDGQLVGSG